jgi:hypothetical protein
MLNEDMYKNFVYTQKLYFNISNMSKPITNERNASVLRHRLEKFLAIYKSAAHGLKSLSLLLQPFIPTDCVVDELWPSVNGCNDLIYALTGEIVHRDSDFEMFDLYLGTGAWTYDVSFRPHLYQLLRLTATRITSLGLTEHPIAITPYLPEMRSLRKLRFHAIGEHDEEQTRSIWKALSGLPLREVILDQLDGSYDFQLFVPQTLTRITMNGVDDIVAACVVCYSQFPNLEHCCLNNGKLKDPKGAPAAVITETVCTKLLQVCFLNSICPAGIISAIARRNHNLHMCLAPPNVTDEDIRLLRANCPSLRTFLMSTANFNSVVPACLISRSGLEHLVHLRRLQTIRLHSDLLPVVDISLLSSIAKSNSVLETLMLLFPDDRHKMWTRQDVREKLLGNESFKEFIGLMKESPDWPPIWAIEGPDLRTTFC